MSNLRVGAIDSVNGNNALAIAADGSMTHGGYAMSTGMVKLADAEWSTDTDGVNFDVIDTSKYIHYKFYWWICHVDAGNTSNHWFQTGMCFRASGTNLDASGTYDNCTSWVSSGTTSGPDWNNGSYAAAQARIWMAGNGQTYDSQGECFISIPPVSDFRAAVRGTSQLIGTPRQGTTGTNYLESFSSVVIGGTNTDPSAITGFRVCAFPATTGRYSKRGYITVYGIER